MKAGKLDRTITLEREAETVNDYGVTASAWTALDTVRAQIVTASTDEAIRQFGERQTTMIVFRIRWFDGLTTADRVVYAARNYNIREITELGRRRGLELRCEAA